MIRHSRVRCSALCIAVLVTYLAGCQQTDTVQNSPADWQSSWLAKLSLPKFKDESSAPGSAVESPDVRMTIARSFEKQGQIDEAIKAYLDIVDKDDRREDVYHRLAVLHDTKGDCRSSEEFYRAALEIDPMNAEVYCDLGYSYYLQRRWPEAETNLRQAISIKPDLARAHVNLGLLLVRTGHVDESLTEFSQAGCSETDARVNLAFAFMLEEQWLEAQQQYEHALAIDPQSQAARDGLNALRSVDPGLKGREVVFANGGGRLAESARATYFSPEMKNPPDTGQ